MNIQELSQNILKAYSIKNLHNISLTLINLYKNKQFSNLQKIADLLSSIVTIEIAEDGKGFAKFMMLYHPDRANFHRDEIEKLTKNEDFEGLLKYAHILKLARIDKIAASLDKYEDIDYAPVYEWDMNVQGFTIITENELSKENYSYSKNKRPGLTFYDAIKIREYGHTHIEYPTYYLEDMDEFELSSSEIDDLDGIQFCIHAISIDVSDNRITDISPLAGLTLLEELNLSDNQIGYIDALSNLLNLKRIFLSNNSITDLSPLFELNKLEYIEISGNTIPLSQINQLIELGITIE